MFILVQDKLNRYLSNSLMSPSNSVLSVSFTPYGQNDKIKAT